MRVGDSKIMKTDARIIAATNRNLLDEVKEGNFRKDLYFRLKTINIAVLPLREHINDMYLFIERFGLEFTAKNDIPFKGFSSEAQLVMKRYAWPGNVRELKNVVESLLVMNKGERITEEMVESYMPTSEQEAEWQKDRDRFIDLTYSPLLREGDLPVSADFGDRKKR